MLKNILLIIKAINDLEVSEKSSTGEKLSAAGLCVGIGSFSDPEELQGLAHFLEHMVSESRIRTSDK